MVARTDSHFIGSHKHLPLTEEQLPSELEAEIEALEQEYEALREQLSQEEDDDQTGGD